MLVTIDWIRERYNKFNKMYFFDKLPKDLEFKISRSKDTWGEAAFNVNLRLNTITPAFISLSNYYDSPEYVKENTLIHEMIHVYDYVTNPQHYIIMHKRNRRYNSHGTWFKNECKRLAQYGYDIQENITEEQEKCSTLSKSARLNLELKKNTTVICAAFGDNGRVWYCKTNIANSSKIMKKIESLKNIISDYVGSIEQIKMYRTTSEKYAQMRSCNTRLVGWTIRTSTFEKEMKDNAFFESV